MKQLIYYSTKGPKMQNKIKVESTNFRPPLVKHCGKCKTKYLIGEYLQLPELPNMPQEPIIVDDDDGKPYELVFRNCSKCGSTMGIERLING